MLETASEKKNNPIETIFDMLDLFYANKHMYDRLKAQERKREQENGSVRKQNIR